MLSGREGGAGRTAAGLLLVDLPSEEERVDQADEAHEHRDTAHNVEIGYGALTILPLEGGALRHEEVDVKGEEDDLNKLEDQHDKHDNCKLGTAVRQRSVSNTGRRTYKQSVLDFLITAKTPISTIINVNIQLMTETMIAPALFPSPFFDLAFLTANTMYMMMVPLGET